MESEKTSQHESGDEELLPIYAGTFAIPMTVMDPSDEGPFVEGVEPALAALEVPEDGGEEAAGGAGAPGLDASGVEGAGADEGALARMLLASAGEIVLVVVEVAAAGAVPDPRTS